ncbi:PAAR motif-containing protein [Streptomyces sp. TLI_235]|nr:PAAR domain-containing protein [Streptomyces sp. TLI_235]PBC75956.1 PAAR motif-containing protein [Streptomyces sp. TLI_235]
MAQPAARQGDQVTGTDTHTVLVPSPPGAPQPVPMPFAFAGTLDSDLSEDVLINGQKAATVGSTADNLPAHLLQPPATAFVAPPENRGTVLQGSPSVYVNGKPLARQGDPVKTCCELQAPATIGAGSPNVVVA